MQLGKVHEMSTDPLDQLAARHALAAGAEGHWWRRYRAQETETCLVGFVHPREMTAHEKAMDESWAVLQKKRAEYATLISEPEERELYPVFEKLLAQYALEHNRIDRHLQYAGHRPGGQSGFADKSQTLSREMNATLDKLTSGEPGGRPSRGARRPTRCTGEPGSWVLGLLLGSMRARPGAGAVDCTHRRASRWRKP